MASTYKAWDSSRSVLVAGSNQGSNAEYKKKVIAKYEEIPDTEVHHTCDIYRSYEYSIMGNSMVLKCLSRCDIYYVAASEGGYVGNATAARLAYAKSLPDTKVISSHKLADPDLQFYVDYVRPLEDIK